MKIRIFSFIVFFSLVGLLAGCGGIKELKVGNITGVKLHGIKDNQLDIELTVPIENPNSFKVKLKDADMAVTSGKTLVGNIRQMDDLVISGHSSQEYSIRVKVELANIKDNMFAIYGLIRDKESLRMTGVIKVRAFPYRGSIKIKDYQLIN